MNGWDAGGKLTGWLPGATIGGLAGGALGILGFESLASECSTGTMQGPLGPVTTSLACVVTPVGDFYSTGAFAAMTGVVGGLLGAAVASLVAALPRSGDEVPPG